MVAVRPQHKTLVAEFLHGDRRVVGQPMSRADRQKERLVVERPAIQPVPHVLQGRGDGEIGFARLENVSDLVALPSEQAQLKTAELALQLGERRGQRRNVDRAREHDGQRSYRLLLDGIRQRTGTERALVALGEKRFEPPRLARRAKLSKDCSRWTGRRT